MQCTKDSATDTVAAWCRDRNYPAAVVGRWVWVSFDSKPDAATRADLKSAGFRWIPRRGEWAHNCGVRTTRGKCVPRLKYGAVPVSQYEGDAA